MTKASGAADNFMLLLAFLFHDRNSLWNSDFSLFSESKLSHLCLTPAVEQPFFSDSKRIVCSCLDALDWLSIE